MEQTKYFCDRCDKELEKNFDLLLFYFHKAFGRQKKIALCKACYKGFKKWFKR